MRVLDLLRGREPIPPHVIERRLEEERQALIKARQDPGYDEAADIQRSRRHPESDRPRCPVGQRRADRPPAVRRR